MIALNPRRAETLLLAAALAFHAIGALSLLALGYAPEVLLPATATFAVCAVGGRLWLDRVAPARDPLLLPAAMLLAGWGLLVVGRVAPNFLGRQTAWLAVATIAMLAVASSRDNLRWLRRFKYTWLILALGLLGATLFLGVNPAGEGARLWLSLAGLFMQPSEILRLLMIAFLAAFFSERAFAAPFSATGAEPAQSRHQRLASIAPSILMWLIASVLLGTQQDLGAAALLLITFASMLYLATGRAALPMLGMVALLLAGIAGYALSPRVAQRVDIWLNPWADPQNRSFQIAQSLMAVASGSVFGQGIGQGRPDYVPAVHTDFPFAVIGEEMGLLGAIGLLAVFGVLILRGWRVAQQSDTSYGMLLAGGLSASLMAQVFVIIGGNLSLLPLTGVTLPFISYGGSSLLVSFISVGLLIRLCDTTNAAREVFRPSPAQHTATRRAMQLSAALVVVLSGAAGYWGVARSAELTARSDNPRLIDAERAIQRGPILARDGTVLARSEPIQRSVYARRYPRPAAAPVIGYASWRHGTGGIETYADPILRGSLTTLDRLLHRPQIGAAFTTTLDIALQERLHRALAAATMTQGSAGGAGIIMDWQTGEVLALTSAPSFDPNRLDEDWDKLRADTQAPLLNRATQGLYQPGPLLQWLYSIAAGSPLTNTTRWDPLDRFDLGQPVPFELDNAYTAYPASGAYSETIGQGTLRITPLRVAATVAGLIAGRPVTPTLATKQGAPAHLPPHVGGNVASALSQPVIHFAQAGRNQYVGWLIARITQKSMSASATEAVLVVALEQTDTSPGWLEEIAREFE
ncbi:MAG: FtsW/RodA/SpoVE family cell cycle protein [Anaerolineae bacterium]